MSLILHLSDIHLGSKDPSFDDAKSEMIPLHERETRQQMLTRTLRKLGRMLVKSGESLQSIFVTGDISYCGDEEGFKRFGGLLNELGPACPPKKRIVVIPGNHDVARSTSPSDPNKYSFFQKYIRSKGFIVPLLDGVDITKSAEKTKIQHHLLNLKERWLVVPINSANYCQIMEPIAPISEAEWSSFTSHLPVDRQTAARKKLENLRVNDAARISIEQFEALEELLHQIHETIIAADEDPSSFVKVALIHHHLLPVSTIEEVKKFESFMNLGLVRSFLAKHKFQVVFHGHKHIAKRYWDYIPSLETNATHDAHRVLVVSGGTLGDSYHRDDEVCRLIHIAGSPGAERIKVASISGALPGHGLNSLIFDDFHLWDHDLETNESSHKLIRGRTVDQTYERILAYFEHVDNRKERANVICEITEPLTAGRIPSTYPSLSAVQTKDRQRWFESLVDWWQLDKPTLSKMLQFTHGHRIFCETDQIGNVIQVLVDKPLSSRAIVTLSRPELDPIHDRKKKFPSFCLAQFIVRQHGTHAPKLDCVALFRKQEMRFWWPINACELSRLQKRVFDGLPKKGFLENLALGSITTIATIAKLGSTPPQVSVPIVDRLLDQAPDLLWAMSYALFWKDMPERQKYLAEWEKVLDDLQPPAGFDPDGIPIPLEGLRKLVTEIRQFAVHHPTKRCDLLIRAMECLFEENQKLVETLLDKNEDAGRRHFELWKPKAKSFAKEIRSSVRSILK